MASGRFSQSSFTLLSALTLGVYILLVSGLSVLLCSLLPVNNLFLIVLITLLVAIAVEPLRRAMLKQVERVFYRLQFSFREHLQSYATGITQLLDVPQILDHLGQEINQVLLPVRMYIFIRNDLSSPYTPAWILEGSPATDLRFSPESILASTLAHHKNALQIMQNDIHFQENKSEHARFVLLNTPYYVPIHGQAGLLGWVALGARRSGKPYSLQEIHFLDDLAGQTALALERSKVIADLNRRIQNMDILSRLAQGINITLDFDDILELIYAQANKLSPSRDFRITLKYPSNTGIYHAFFLEDDERLPEHENQPLSGVQGLEREIINSGQALAVDDYERECKNRGLHSNAQAIYAWVGVPIYAGKETIGAISLGSRDPGVSYGDEQIDLLQSIADQAAGAIVKARLLQETQQHASQLATLNEIGRSLTSTLETRPLLEKILASAVEILSCEAGSLFLVDEQTGENVFEVVTGPVAANLLGQRIPAGTGLVGKTVDSGVPVIANAVQRDKTWFDQPDKDTGFTTRDILAVPMRLQERVIGVIEVINKIDGSSFSLVDQELLATFTSQAVIAIENARLYSQTDAALAARVEELSVMQLIDRELNASLDDARGMRITLEWAMRKARAEAGLIGYIRDAELLLAAWQGYSDQEIDNQTPLVIMRLPAVTQAVQTFQPQVISFPESVITDFTDGSSPPASTLPYSLLKGAKQQLVIPIGREGIASAVLLLETTSTVRFTKEALDFLTRLSDHAAIAIYNGQLYAAVQAANNAKSEFVSLVSHELKTPMTAIKGYTDLLAAGAVGPVNEMQANFLGTIRSNVMRMATLVSDLSDISRIESGRMRLEYAAVSVDELIHDVVRSAQAQVDEKKQVLSLDYQPDLPAVWGDKTRISQILVNLVSNAHKYTPSGGRITILAERSDLDGDSRGATDVVHFAVRDTGYGISPDDQKKVYTKFFRSDDANVRESPGTGLGLNITRTLVEMQGGRIWFESELHNGTTFHFTIPAAAN